jgi:hypothetical protein
MSRAPKNARGPAEFPPPATTSPAVCAGRWPCGAARTPAPSQAAAHRWRPRAPHNRPGGPRPHDGTHRFLCLYADCRGLRARLRAAEHLHTVGPKGEHVAVPRVVSSRCCCTAAKACCGLLYRFLDIPASWKSRGGRVVTQVLDRGRAARGALKARIGTMPPFQRLTPLRSLGCAPGLDGFAHARNRERHSVWVPDPSCEQGGAWRTARGRAVHALSGSSCIASICSTSMSTWPRQ